MTPANGNSSSLPRTADILILGAGGTGASIAFHLAKRNPGKIIVLDKDHVGRGGSGRSSALVRMHYSLSVTGTDQPADVSELADRGGAAGRFSQDRLRAHRAPQRNGPAETQCLDATQTRRNRGTDRAAGSA